MRPEEVRHALGVFPSAAHDAGGDASVVISGQVTAERASGAKNKSPDYCFAASE